MKRRLPGRGSAVGAAALAALSLLGATGACAADERLPVGLSLIAQDAQGHWGLHAVQQGTLRAIPTELEPRQACVSFATGTAFYAAADESLRLVELATGRETVLARSDARRSYTQPCLSADGRERYAVEMQDGKSIETEIVHFVPAPGGGTAGSEALAQPMARQPGAQLDPFLAVRRWLVYTSVACSDGCDRLMTEIWVRDLLAGTARQLSLLNAVSQSPVTDGSRVVFSSNAGGPYSLWQVRVDGSGLQRLTAGPDSDLQPALCQDALYFVRATPEGYRLMRLPADGQAQALALPGLQRLRALRCIS